MRRVKEKVAEQKIVAWAEAHGVLSIKLNLQGRRGWPDRVFFLPGGRPYLVEIKAKGEVLRPLQAYVHSQLTERGYDVDVFSSEADAIGALKKRLKEVSKVPASKGLG